METQFEKIWLDYNNILPVQSCEFDIYLKIINKIRKKDDISDCKKDLIELIDLLILTIYNYKYKDDENIFDDEINCCYLIKNKYLNDFENKYKEKEN